MTTLKEALDAAHAALVSAYDEYEDRVFALIRAYPCRICTEDRLTDTDHATDACPRTSECCGERFDPDIKRCPRCGAGCG